MTMPLSDSGPANGDTAPPSTLAALRARIARLVELPAFGGFVTFVIVVNAVTLGLETWPPAVELAGGWLRVFDRTALAIFTIEIALKLVAYGPRFFRTGWNLFDFVIVAVALMPSSGVFSVLRALRILRALRLLSVVPQMRTVVNALLTAVPGMGAIVAVLLLLFYVAAVMATKLFGASFDQWFGTVGESMYSLFQIMTLESWSMGIVRPVMEVYPWAWVFFVPFIIVTSFAVLNLFIALIVNSLQAIHDADTRELQHEIEAAAAHERHDMAEQMAGLRREIRDLRDALLDRRGAARRDDG
jgi:voltage-gated sodium channel